MYHQEHDPGVRDGRDVEQQEEVHQPSIFDEGRAEGWFR